MIKKVIFLWVVLLFMGLPSGAQSIPEEFVSETFSFAFFTDIHFNPENAGSDGGLRLAITEAKKLGVDFIATGGDNVDIDGLGNDIEKAERFYARFSEILQSSGTDFRVSIGNHDRFWHGEETRTEHGTGMFRRFFGNPYFSYDHKGVHFIHLNTAEVCEGKYCVSDEQRKWLAGLLAEIGTAKPLVVIGHVPFLSYYYPALEGVFTDKDMFFNFKEIWDMLRAHNLQLVLQGHQHLYEEINVLGTQFITGGAVSAGWWAGAFHGTEEGFVHLKWDGRKISREYVDYGWEAKSR